MKKVYVIDYDKNCDTGIAAIVQGNCNDIANLKYQFLKDTYTDFAGNFNFGLRSGSYSSEEYWNWKFETAQKFANWLIEKQNFENIPFEITHI
jgi:hypothetical protein